MTKPLRKAVGIIARVIRPKKKVLEVGSRQEKNQQEIAQLRGFFEEKEYIGIDMRPGPGVDIVVNAEKLPFPDNHFDVVLCLEVLEHAEKPWMLAEEILRVVKKDGVVMVSSQQNFPIHSHPSDYFRYTPFGLSSLFSELKSKLVFTIDIAFNNKGRTNPEHVILVGTRKNNLPLIKQLRKAIKNGEQEISIHKPYRHRVRDAWSLLKHAWWEGRHRLKIEFF